MIRVIGIGNRQTVSSFYWIILYPWDGVNLVIRGPDVVKFNPNLTQSLNLRWHGQNVSWYRHNSYTTLEWRHSESDAVLNRRRLDCLLNRFLRRRWKKTSKSSASLAVVRGIYRGRWIPRWPVNSPHIGPVTRKMLPFDDVIMKLPGKLA